jgi:branched-chain amino acid transport system substrate-binding protein
MKIKKIALSIALLTLSSQALSQANQGPLKIGFIGDMSGLYADIDGKGSVESFQMAIDDFGGKVLGRKIELISADHQNKPDIAASKAREWIDQEGVNVIFGGTNSGAALATAKVTDEKKRLYINNGAGSSVLTNEQCSPYTIHYTYDTIALSNVTAKAVMDQGYKSWYFLTADYAFGLQLQKDAAKVVEAGGGKVVGSSKHPLSASDFSSFLLQAQNSGAQVLGLANAGGDTINAVKSASEFGINKKMKIAGLLVFITDVHSIGIKNAQGLSVASPWYWDQDDASREFAGRFIRKLKRMPTMNQAGVYSSTMTYLKAVKAAGTDNPEKVLAEMKKMKINDMFTKGGYIRKDGTMVHDFYLYEVKKPDEVTKPWDYYKLIKKVPGEQAFNTLAESKCAFINK